MSASAGLFEPSPSIVKVTAPSIDTTKLIKDLFCDAMERKLHVDPFKVGKYALLAI